MQTANCGRMKRDLLPAKCDTRAGDIANQQKQKEKAKEYR
jgi:hypothetical protein